MAKSSFIPSRYFIEVYEDMYGCTASSKMFMPLPKCELDMEKCLKKWYNHLYKQLPAGFDSIEYHAMREDEDGTYADLSMYWGCETMEYDPEIPFHTGWLKKEVV